MPPQIRKLVERGKDKIALRVGKVINKFKMAKHFEISITDESFSCQPILFDDHDSAEAAKSRPNMVAPAERSEAAKRKAKTKMTEDYLAVHSFQTLLADLATITKNTVEVTRITNGTARFEKLTRPTPVQQRAFDLLGVKLTV